MRKPDGSEDHPVGTWTVDPARSKIEWTLPQIVGKTRGSFARFDATIVSNAVLRESSVTATITLASLDTGNAKRDEHLRGPKYLDVDVHPTASYRSQALRHARDGAVIDGALTLLGVTASVPLHLHSWRIIDEDGQKASILKASAEFSRRTFGLTIPMDGGGRIFSDSLMIDIEVFAVQE